MKPKIVMSILEAKTQSLYELAKLSGLDVFTFYRGSDLVGLDLSGQDLRGLSFYKADLRFSSTEDISFDPGAFNGSVLTSDQEWLLDDFSFYKEEVQQHPNADILLFVRLRTGLVTRCLEHLNIAFNHFAALANVSENALRKARRDGVVAVETASKILSGLTTLANDGTLFARLNVEALLRQPVAQFLHGGVNSAFKPVDRQRYEVLLAMRRAVVAFHETTEPRSGGGRWRDTPDALQWWHDNGLPEQWRVDQQKTSAPWRTDSTAS